MLWPGANQRVIDGEPPRIDPDNQAELLLAAEFRDLLRNVLLIRQ